MWDDNVSCKRNSILFITNIENIEFYSISSDIIAYIGSEWRLLFDTFSYERIAAHYQYYSFALFLFYFIMFLQRYRSLTPALTNIILNWTKNVHVFGFSVNVCYTHFAAIFFSLNEQRMWTESIGILASFFSLVVCKEFVISRCAKTRKQLAVSIVKCQQQQQQYNRNIFAFIFFFEFSQTA